MRFIRPQSLPGKKRRRLLPALGASAALVALAACGPAAPSDTAQSDKPSDTALGSAWQEENFPSFYSQTIQWRHCTEDDGLSEDLSDVLPHAGVDPSTFECATVKAPMNWTDPADERTIDLAIVRVPATGDRENARPLFGNPGGPGISGIEYTMTLPASPGFEAVQQAYDSWGFDPRGVGRSTPVTCDSTSELPVVQLAECAAANPLAHYMGTSQVARDMELLRALSGAPRLDYLGYSYGTMLGATYATLFPDKAGRMVLDSAESAEWASITHSFDQQVAVAKAAGHMADACPTMVTDKGEPVTCPFTTEEEMLSFKESLDAEPLRASNGTELTSDDMRGHLTDILYMPPIDRAGALDTIGKAKAGDQESIDAIAASLEEGGTTVGPAGQITACHSSPMTPDVAGLIAHMKEVGVPRFIGGPEISDEVLEEFTQAECSVLAETGDDFTDSFDASKTSTPLLVIGITGDHATPYQHGQELARQLGNASFLTVEGSGHSASYSGMSTCVDDAVTAYLLEGALPEAGATCTADPVE